MDRDKPHTLWNKQNLDLFDLLGVAYDERAHGRVLAQLMDPEGTHGLEDRFLRSFLGLVHPGASGWYTRDATVQRERWGVDIVIDLPTANAVFAVELKIRASEAPEQVARHQAAVKAFRHRTFVAFVTPEGRPPVTHNPDSPVPVVPLSWGAVAGAMRAVAQDAQSHDRSVLELYAYSIETRARQGCEVVNVGADHVFIGAPEAARRLDRSSVTIRRWYRAGKLPGRQLGGRIQIDERAVLAIEAGSVLPEADDARGEPEDVS